MHAIACLNAPLKFWRLKFSEGDADGDKKEKVEDVENAETAAS